MANDEKRFSPDEYPSVFQPVAFADGASSTAWGNGVVKFYLYRIDPHLNANGPGKNQAFGQVVMTTNGFLQMTTFFQQTIQQMLTDGTITEEMVAAVEKGWQKAPAANG